MYCIVPHSYQDMLLLRYSDNFVEVMKIADRARQGQNLLEKLHQDTERMKK